jgi:hypothetical protein
LPLILSLHEQIPTLRPRKHCRLFPGLAWARSDGASLWIIRRA